MQTRPHELIDYTLWLSVYWLVELQAISDPYSQAACLWLSASAVCLSVSVWLVLYRQRPRYTAKLAALRATSPTALSVVSACLPVS